jgi:hypothetical protein
VWELVTIGVTGAENEWTPTGLGRPASGQEQLPQAARCLPQCYGRRAESRSTGPGRVGDLGDTQDDQNVSDCGSAVGRLRCRSEPKGAPMLAGYTICRRKRLSYFEAPFSQHTRKGNWTLCPDDRSIRRSIESLGLPTHPGSLPPGRFRRPRD